MKRAPQVRGFACPRVCEVCGSVDPRVAEPRVLMPTGSLATGLHAHMVQASVSALLAGALALLAGSSTLPAMLDGCLPPAHRGNYAFSYELVFQASRKLGILDSGAMRIP